LHLVPCALIEISSELLADLSKMNIRVIIDKMDDKRSIVASKATIFQVQESGNIVGKK
jgi:hypothetical protein